MDYDGISKYYVDSGDCYLADRVELESKKILLTSYFTGGFFIIMEDTESLEVIDDFEGMDDKLRHA